jgi:hypothetical protein
MSPPMAIYEFPSLDQYNTELEFVKIHKENFGKKEKENLSLTSILETDIHWLLQIK